MKWTQKGLVPEILLTLLGTAVLALGLHVFIAPNNLAPGGVSGISIVISYLIGSPLGWTNLAINIPLLVLGYVYLGKRFIVKTMISVASFTLFYDYLFAKIPQYTGELLLASLFGGVLIGAGVGIAFSAESSTGGLDISSKVLQMKFPHISIGRIVFFTDAAVIIVSAVVFRSVESAMFAVIAMFVSSKVVDAFIYGLDIGKMVMIVTDREEEISEVLLKEIDRGLTKVDSLGVYSKKKKGLLICAVRNNEYYHLKRVIKEVDPSAFMIVTTATEVVGEGFKAIDKL